MSDIFYEKMMDYSRGLACISPNYIHQGNRRWKYFEQDGYRKLSDILQIENYSTFIDVYMLAHYITGIIPDEYDEDEIADIDDIYEYVSDVIRCNESEDINWENVIAYMDEQKEAIKEQDDGYEGIQRLYESLEPIKDELLKRNDAFCLYRRGPYD